MIAREHLWAVGFDDVQQAEQLRAEVTRLGERRCLILRDTAVVVRYPDGCVTLDREPFVSVDFPSHTLARLLAGLALGAPPVHAGRRGTGWPAGGLSLKVRGR